MQTTLHHINHDSGTFARKEAPSQLNEFGEHNGLLIERQNGTIRHDLHTNSTKPNGLARTHRKMNVIAQIEAVEREFNSIALKAKRSEGQREERKAKRK
tara:strand:+ start:521 stop:817 length:297 start_codon:yes stop_codon:yes gene_type:complete